MKTSSDILEYRRADALAYALKWALGRNPQFYDYSALGGDCTNFASQVLWAGGALMNYDHQAGWYYKDPNRKSPSWTGVNFLFEFLINNRGRGPFARLAGPEEMLLGDLIQLSFRGGGKFDHTLVVTQRRPPFDPENIEVSTHTYDSLNGKLSNYTWREIRYIHILGCRN